MGEAIRKVFWTLRDARLVRVSISSGKTDSTRPQFQLFFCAEAMAGELLRQPRLILLVTIMSVRRPLLDPKTDVRVRDPKQPPWVDSGRCSYSIVKSELDHEQQWIGLKVRPAAGAQSAEQGCR